MLGFLYSVLVTCLVMGLLYWIATVLLPEPFKKVVCVIILVICAIYLLGLLFGMAPPYPVFRGRF